MTDKLAERVAASRDYDMLRGLVAAGCGAAFVLAALTAQPIVLAFGTIIAASVGAGWYQKRYGNKRTPTGRQVGTVVAALAVMFALSVASGYDYFQEAPILLTSLVGAIALGAGYRVGLKHIGMTVWHWLAIGALALTTLLPLVGWRPDRWGLWIPFSLALIVIGLVDHAHLVRIFSTGNADD